MSTSEILAQLPRLTALEREQVRAKLDEIDSAVPLSPEEKQLIDARVAAYRQRPDAAIPWSVAESEIRKELGL
jgi:hypothetical protein